MITSVAQTDKEAIVLFPGEGKYLSLLGVTIAFKAASDDTDGAWSLVEYSMPAAFAGPRPHWHDQMTEAFYVVAGVVTFQLGEQTIKATPGTFIFVPTGMVHTFSNTENHPAKMLTFTSPAGFEEYFEELADLIADEGTWPPRDMNRLSRLLDRYDRHHHSDVSTFELEAMFA